MTPSRFLRRLFFAATILSVSQVKAQTRATYRASADTLRYEITTPHMVQWIRGADTVRGPTMPGWVIESQAWRQSASGEPEVLIRSVNLGMDRAANTYDFVIHPDGRLALKDGKPPAPDAWTDVFPRLPKGGKLSPGLRWSDTITLVDTSRAHPQSYRQIREYRFERELDSLGRRLVEFSGTGRESLWVVISADSLGAPTSWIDVEGPFLEHVLFDMTFGRLIRRKSSANLEGRGVATSGSDTVRARATKATHMELVSPSRSAFLLEGLPGSDSSLTYSVAHNEPLTLHTVHRADARITSSLTDPHGRLGVASLSHSSGRVVDYTATWADTSGRTLHHTMQVRGDSIVLKRTGERDTTFVAPARRWGVAEAGMQELLTPSVLAFPRDARSYPFAVLRPSQARWDWGEVLVKCEMVW